MRHYGTLFLSKTYVFISQTNFKSDWISSNLQNMQLSWRKTCNNSDRWFSGIMFILQLFLNLDIFIFFHPCRFYCPVSVQDQTECELRLIGPVTCETCDFLYVPNIVIWTARLVFTSDSMLNSVLCWVKNWL